MRFLLCILIWILFVGGLWAYTVQRDAALPQAPGKVPVGKTLTGEYVLEITPSFSTEKDPFAQAADDESQDSGLEIRLNGQPLAVEAGEILRGKVIRITDGIKLSPGFNEFYVKASPPMSETNLDHGIRVRLTDRGAPLVDRTVWGSRGAVVTGTVSVTLAAQKEGSHDH